VLEAGLGRDEKGRSVAGNSGNGDRPKGSRNQLAEAFVADLYASWLAHGFATIEKVRTTRPADLSQGDRFHFADGREPQCICRRKHEP
jgi:hypothetical protein